jgi:hypothetical protein
MSAAVCPSCGVAVVPGYVRCPRCHKPLPQRKSSHVEGGTAVPSARRGPLLGVIGVAVLALAFVIYFALDKPTKPAPQQAAPARAADDTSAPEPAQAPDQPAAPEPPAGPDAQDVAAGLARALEKQRLWSTVNIVGDRVDVRSGSCSDPAMAPLLESAAHSFKAAGLTKLRCLEQSGRVVTDRDL